MARHFSADEIDRLRLLRSIFVSFETREGGAEPYWDSPEELALYDETYAQRIGWKWDAVLEELRRRGRLPRGATVLDWGCGTAIAARRYLAASGEAERVFLWDHAPAALEFARERLREQHPDVEVGTELPGEPVDVLLVSHVLDELDASQLEPLLELAERAGAVLWVEPGSRRTSRRLGELRARLAESLDVLGPCTHQATCGALAREDAWCHFFGRPPQAVYTEGPWAEFSRELGIDLRALPYSFLALARRGTFGLEGPAARLVARPRLTRGRAEFELCDASGLHGVDFLQRTDKRLYKELEDVAGEPWLFDATLEGRRVTAMERRDT